MHFGLSPFKNFIHFHISSVTKKKPAQLVIPLIQKNNWRVVSDDADQEAAEEIIKCE